jgi:hypothetical protein
LEVYDLDFDFQMLVDFMCLKGSVAIFVAVKKSKIHPRGFTRWILLSGEFF